MNVMIDLKTLFLIVLGIALLVLIVYLIQLTRKLLTSMDHTINILEDVATITDLAAKRSKDVDGIIGDVSESVESLSKAVKGDQNIFSAISCGFCSCNPSSTCAMRSSPSSIISRTPSVIMTSRSPGRI